MSEEARSSSEGTAPFPWPGRHAFNARVFFSGSLCGGADYPAEQGIGHLHLLHRGPARLLGAGAAPLNIDRPSLVLFARPRGHRLEADERSGADLVCARLSVDEADAGLLLFGFPDCLVVTLDELTGLEAIMERLLDEAASQSFGQQTAVDLLVELLMIMLLRHCLDRGLLSSGLLAGLAEPRLARSLAAMHRDPGADLTIERLSAIAGMSRSTFAAAFKEKVGVSPGDYLTLIRLSAAKRGLRAGRPLKAVAASVGYGSTTALSRAFQRHFGLGPRDWLAAQRREAAGEG